MKMILSIDLEPYLQDYLIAIFGYDQSRNAIDISTTHPEGKFILSMWEPIEREYARTIENECRIILPGNNYNSYKLQTSYVHIPAWKEKMISDYLKSIFELKMRELFSLGRHFKIPQKIICEAIISHYNTKNSVLTFDKVKKYDYRKRKKYNQKLITLLQSANI